MAGYWLAAAANCSLKQARADTLYVGQQRVVRAESRWLQKAIRLGLHLRGRKRSNDQGFERGCVKYCVIGFNNAKSTNVMPLA
jgi:hypothetical protein